MKPLLRAALLLAALLPVGRIVHAAEPARPNVLLILADDMGFSDAGCYGGEIRTPNLDALAKNGLRFTQFYNTARCWPSRAAILTGYYAQQVRRDTVPGVKSGGQGVRPGWARLLPEMLRPLGYRTYHSGKWHVDGKPLQNGFDHSYSLNDHDRHFTPRAHTEDDRPLPPVKAGGGYYSTTAIADHAIKCLKEHAVKYPNRPFFEYLAFTSPHFPLHAPPEDIERYSKTYLLGWDELREQRWRRLKDLHIGGTVLSPIERDVGPPYAFPNALKKLGPNELNRPLPWQDLTADQKAFQAKKMAIHAAMVDRMDREIGRVLGQLRTMGALDNTLIFFLSDNGASAEIMVRGDGHDPHAECGTGATFLSIGPGWSSLANTPFRRHKTWVHEGGISTPLIVHWPRGIAARGEMRHTPGHVIDLVPTILEVVSGKRPEKWEGKAVPVPPGKSLVPLFKKDGTVKRDFLWWLHEGNRALRAGDWKIVAAGKNSPWELYDLGSDRSETRNLAREHPEKVRELATLWTRQLEQCIALAHKDLPPGASAAPKKRPNILFCFADDWGRYASIYAAFEKHASPNQVIRTPNIDRVAREGVLFRHAFVNAPSCTPCRSALLTGRYFFNTGRGAILQGAQWDARIPTFPLLLRDSGYHIGKTSKVWSPGTPVDAPFGGQKYAYEKAGRLANDYSEHVTRMVREGMSAEAARDRILKEVRGNFTAFLADRKPDQPFLYWFGPTNVHRIWIKGSGKALWKIDPDSLKGKLPPFLPDVPEVREDFADYLGEVQAFDAYVGVLLAELERTKQLDDTLIVISGDHGPPGFPHGKCNLYDFGVGVTLAVRWPGGTPGRVVDDFVNLMDLTPTFLEVGGVKAPEGIKGRSFLDVLKSAKSGLVDEKRTWVVTGRERHVAAARAGNVPYPQRALRTRDFLYIRNYEPSRWPMGDPTGISADRAPSAAELETNTFAAFADMDASPTKAWLVAHRNDADGKYFYNLAFAPRPAEELYDLRRDRDQVHNVAGQARYAAEKAALAKRLQDILQKAGDPRATGDDRFEKPPFTEPETPKKNRPKGS